MNDRRVSVVALLLAAALAWAPLAGAEGSGSGAVAGTGDAAAGAAVFHATCVVCHARSGRGTLPGMPDFNAPDGVLSLPTPVLEQRITRGFDDGKAPMAMPPKGNNDRLTQADIRNVIAYLRVTFAH
jgi:mono/diheme cytochrome c family protein